MKYFHNSDNAKFLIIADLSWNKTHMVRWQKYFNRKQTTCKVDSIDFYKGFLLEITGGQLSTGQYPSAVLSKLYPSVALPPDTVYPGPTAMLTRMTHIFMFPDDGETE